MKIKQSISDIDFSSLDTFSLKLWHLSQRPTVQGQLLILVLSLILAETLGFLIWRFISIKVPHYQRLIFDSQQISPKVCGIRLAYFLVTPVFLLIFLNISHYSYHLYSTFDGLIDHGILLTLIFIIYRLCLTIASFFLPIDQIQYFRKNLFKPVLYYFFIASSINLVEDYRALVSKPFFMVFETPISIQSILLLTFGIYFWIFMSLLLGKVIVYYLDRQNSFDSEFLRAMSVLVHYGFVGIGIFTILGYVGINPAIFATITGGLSVGIGFGLKEVISNFVSGIWLLIEGALKPGDIINVEGEMSQVEKLGFRAATVKIIRDNSERILPNQIFFTKEVNTYTGSSCLVYRSITVGTSYDCNPAQVIKILKQVANGHSEVLASPAPTVFLLDFGESSLDFELKFWLNDALVGKRVSSELRFSIWQAFDRAGIEIPYPQRDLHIRSDRRHLSPDSIPESPPLDPAK